MNTRCSGTYGTIEARGPAARRGILAWCTALSLFVLAACTGPSFDLKPGEAEGYRIYREYCGQCHRPQKPSHHTAEEWPRVIERMRVHMVEMQRNVISDEQAEKLLVFLKGHAGT